MPETGTQNSSTSIASQLIRELELNGPLPDPRTDIDHQSLVSLYPELGAVSAVDITVPTPEGGVPGRVYRAPGAALAGFVWVHGGAFIAGDLNMPEAHWVSLYLASQGISVLSLDYRKALHGLKYPAPSHDVRAGWLWAVENSSALGLATADDLHLGGASAGAALTAALTGRLRDDAGQMPASLLLAYPLVHAEIPALSEELGKKMDGVPAELAFGTAFIRDINLNFAGVSLFRKSQKVSGSFHMSIYHDTGVDIEGIAENNVRGLSSDTGKFFEFFHCSRNFAIVFFHQHLRASDETLRFVVEEVY